MKHLLEQLQEKYPQYFIQEISEKDLIPDAKEQFISINITPHIKEDGSIAYKLRRKSKPRSQGHPRKESEKTKFSKKGTSKLRSPRPSPQRN